MEEKEFHQLLIKYRRGECSEQEKVMLESWYLKLSDEGTAPSEDQINRAYYEVKKVVLPRSARYWGALRQVAAAAAIFVMASAAFFLFQPTEPVLKKVVKIQSNDQPLPNDPLPGNNRAVLTLSDGSSIDLDGAHSGELANQGGTDVNKTAQGKLVYASDRSSPSVTKVVYNTVSTPRGGQYHVVLPDGTNVWLNAASSIHFPTQFTGDRREVRLNGEAYFEVAKNKSMPFIVSVNESQVEVLGTHFNILSYEDEVLTTTLLEGSVKLKHHGAERIIHPGQAALLQKNIQVEEVDAAEAIAWKEGVTAFNNADIYSIMRQISRWYDLDVVYRGQLPDRKFTGKIPRSARLSKVLKVLELSDINFRIADKKIIVTP